MAISNTYKSIIVAVAIVIATGALAQVLPPPQIEIEPPVQSQPQPSAELVPMNRTMMCTEINTLRQMMASQMMIPVGTGTKLPEFIPGDPFDGVLVLRNPQTLAYYVILISTPENTACVIAMGNFFITDEEMQNSR